MFVSSFKKKKTVMSRYAVAKSHLATFNEVNLQSPLTTNIFSQSVSGNMLFIFSLTNQVRLPRF